MCASEQCMDAALVIMVVLFLCVLQNSEWMIITHRQVVLFLCVLQNSEWMLRWLSLTVVSMCASE